MKLKGNTIISLFIIWFFTNSTNAEIHIVNSQEGFDQAHDNASLNDSIMWESGVYTDIYLDISNDGLFVFAEILGETIFTAESRVNISGNNITLQGFQFIGGNIGTKDVINITGSNNLITQINIRAYTSYKYLRIRESSQYVSVTYCNFENRLNLDDQNILSILVDDTSPGYHKVQHCSFKNFDGTGNDLGIEPIRIGLSTQANRISRSLVEYCYFTQCNGDGELISSKARQNVYRYNTFENNPKAELVLRHGSENIVYGNFFLRGKGGVRVREGQDQYIYNNYFYELNDRAIYLQNEDSDPLDNINIAFNTIISCSEIILGGDGSDKPTNVTFSNNIFADPDDDLFEEPTGTETWISNIAIGNLGMPIPTHGIQMVDPQLSENVEGFFGLGPTSPAIDAAETGYATLPIIDGIADLDTDIRLDLMKQARPLEVTDKDLGCNEHPHTVLIHPIATEENTGPDYNTSIINQVREHFEVVDDLFRIKTNPVHDQLTMSIESQRHAYIEIDLLDLQGGKIMHLLKENNFYGIKSIVCPLHGLSSGMYSIRAMRLGQGKPKLQIQHDSFIKL